MITGLRYRLRGSYKSMITKQRRWAEKNMSQGLCRSCGKKLLISKIAKNMQSFSERVTGRLIGKNIVFV